MPPICQRQLKGKSKATEPPLLQPNPPLSLSPAEARQELGDETEGLQRVEAVCAVGAVRQVHDQEDEGDERASGELSRALAGGACITCAPSWCLLNQMNSR